MWLLIECMYVMLNTGRLSVVLSGKRKDYIRREEMRTCCSWEKKAMLSICSHTAGAKLIWVVLVYTIPTYLC